ncbi:Asp-tRNA(Asn)/Glu-tRNA(Gln) amidotransferase subunit GatB [Candidatus Woesebacteria bacterium]|nr:Asp-tRNA(Asn)/Glu-tRNA(Gln) amidotransferase subunit GatB [Candidatus Woesebacteria bacterium]
MNKYRPVIGLEVHIELSTNTKMFCGCSPNHFGKEANTQVCPVCLGLPGALPFPNRQAVLDTIKFGLAFNCEINNFSKFDRKHYFYPDLPKGYQISQYDIPLSINGEFQIPGTKKIVKIRRIHLEEDTGKLVHQSLGVEKVSLIDFNRSGVALLELVTEPDFSDPREVSSFLKEVQLVARYLGISGADMEKGSMRLEANVSVVKVDDEIAALKKLPDYKVELKNINSFRFLEKAINAELVRQQESLEKGEKLIQETRGFNESTGKTFSQRTKEEAKDYRYFPEPDIPPVELENDQIEKLINQMPELPKGKRERFIKDYEISSDYIEILVQDYNKANYYEESVKLGKDVNISPKVIAGLIINKNLDKEYPEPAGLIKKVREISKKEYSKGQEVEVAVTEVMAANQKLVEDYRNGKVQILGFLIGQVQKVLKGKGNPKTITELLLKNLQNN